MYAACNVLINDIPFTLAQGDAGDEDSLYIYCDFGKPTGAMKAVAFERVLQTNLFVFGNNTPVFGLSEASGHIVLMHRMVISQMAFESLTYVLTNFIEHVKKWRDLIFMPPMPAADVTGLFKNLTPATKVH
jgi:hypothetical protein